MKSPPPKRSDKDNLQCCKAVAKRNVRKFQQDDTLQRKRICACLSLCFLYGNSNGLSWDTKRGFFMPSNRVSDCRASGATWNENRPGSPTVKPNEGTEVNRENKAIVRVHGGTTIMWMLVLSFCVGKPSKRQHRCKREISNRSYNHLWRNRHRQ